MITIQDNQITFELEGAPKLVHNLLAHYVQDNKIICAIWETTKVPKADNKLAYMYYEAINHFSKSEYLYFPIPNGAGMILKPHIRNRFHIKDVTPYLQLNILN